MQLKSLIRGCAVATILVGSVALRTTLAAGEAIQFSSDKVKPVAASENPLTKDRLMPKSKLAVSGASSLESASSSMMGNDSRRRLDAKEERRRDNKKLEDENWMILDEGDLQAQDDHDEVYGRSDFESDKKRTSSDIWFATKQGEAAREAGAARSRNSNLRAPGQNRSQGAAAEDKDASFSFARRLGREADTKSDRDQAKESGGAAPNGTDSALKELFNPGNSPARNFEGRGGGRSEPGLRSFDTPGGRASSLGSSFGFGQSAASVPSMKDSVFKPAASTPPLSPFGAPGRFGGASDTPNSWIGPVKPPQTQPPADSSPVSPRRFDVPSRPGFGR